MGALRISHDIASFQMVQTLKQKQIKLSNITHFFLLFYNLLVFALYHVLTHFALDMAVIIASRRRHCTELSVC